MSNIIKIVHLGIDANENTTLSADVAINATTLSVKNIHNFANKNFLLLGSLGEEKSEIVKISGTPTGHTITVSALKQAHADGDPIYRLNYDKIRVYRATSATGTYTLVATIDMDVDEDETYYTDSTGITTSWYKATFFNSDDSTETNIANSSPVRAEIELIAIPGDVKANSFLTLDMAEEEMDKILNNETWINADQRDRARALIMATEKINSFNFKYDKSIYDQFLKFPCQGYPSFSGNVQSGTTTSIVCSSLINDAYYPDYWKYAGVRILRGTGMYSSSLVKTYDYLTGTITLNDALSATPDTTTQFMIMYKIPDEIRKATAKTALWILDNGNTQEDPNIKSKSLGKYSVTYFDKSEKTKLPDDVMAILNSFIRRLGV